MKNVDLIAEKIAKDAIKIATSGKNLPDEFELKDLFPKESWENFPVGARRSAGKKFKEYINNQPNIKRAKTTTANHSIYKLIPPN
ncbi:MAG: single-stranded DNA-binding protein [Ligilactobacillus sp.]|nr:single-stranded DNA-binding protein [Ligilactobacillus sp.]